MVCFETPKRTPQSSVSIVHSYGSHTAVSFMHVKCKMYAFFFRRIGAGSTNKLAYWVGVRIPCKPLWHNAGHCQVCMRSGSHQKEPQQNFLNLLQVFLTSIAVLELYRVAVDSWLHLQIGLHSEFPLWVQAAQCIWWGWTREHWGKQWGGHLGHAGGLYVLGGPGAFEILQEELNMSLRKRTPGWLWSPSCHSNPVPDKRWRNGWMDESLKVESFTVQEFCPDGNKIINK